jgi:hypothetical protein
MGGPLFRKVAQINIQELREILGEIIDEKLDEKLSKIGNGKKIKRAPSEYNLFISACTKEGKDFKECAAEWKKNKVDR